MDLTRDVPRSPYEKLGGIVFLPRSIDKGRADLAGTLGEYVARTGRSERLFDFLGVSAGDFVEALRDRPTDEDLWAWVAEHMTPRTPEEIEALQPEDVGRRARGRDRSLDVARVPEVSWRTVDRRTARTSRGTSTVWISTRGATCPRAGVRTNSDRQPLAS